MKKFWIDYSQWINHLAQSVQGILGFLKGQRFEPTCPHSSYVTYKIEMFLWFKFIMKFSLLNQYPLKRNMSTYEYPIHVVSLLYCTCTTVNFLFSVTVGTRNCHGFEFTVQYATGSRFSVREEKKISEIAKRVLYNIICLYHWSSNGAGCILCRGLSTQQQ